MGGGNRVLGINDMWQVICGKWYVPCRSKVEQNPKILSNWTNIVVPISSATIFNATIDDHGSNQENEEGKESPATLPVTALHGETQILADSPQRIVLIVFTRAQPRLPTPSSCP